MADLSCIELSPRERTQLLQLARQTVAAHLGTCWKAPVIPEPLPPALARENGAFVTLNAAGRLRGCMGVLQSTDPLVRTVANAACDAALRDPRFPPLQAAALEQVRIEISVLSSLQPLPARDREDLLATLRPCRDGLLLRDGECHGTFLPSVWQQLPEAEQFLQQLLTKAGLPPDHWSDKLRLYRYQAVSFAEDPGQNESGGTPAASGEFDA